MTSPYVHQPTRLYSEALMNHIGKSQTTASVLRNRLEGAESLARQIKEGMEMSSRSYVNADDLMSFIQEAISDYLAPLEEALQDDYERAQKDYER